MNQAAYCLFETPVGACGIAWRETGDARHPHAVLRFQLPEASPQLTEKCIARSSGSLPVVSPPPQIAELIARIQQHLAGNPQDFQNVPLDLAGVADFARQVYEAALKIPPGQTTTYGELARVVGRPAESRAVGQAMAKNPIPLIIPCHRVLAANGKFGGFSAHGARQTKARLLAIEGAKFPGVLDFPA